MAKQPERLLCQACGIEAPTKYVEFYQNIGMLVARRSKTVKASLCKKCVHKYFWQMTGTTMAVGWLGYISVCLAPFFVLNNTIRYVGAAGMPKVPPGAKAPVLDNDSVARIYPHLNTIIDRLNRGETLVAVAKDIAPQAAVTPGQVLMYVIAWQKRMQSEPQKPTGGFPVVPLPAANVSGQVAVAPPPLPAIPVAPMPPATATPPQLGPKL